MSASDVINLPQAKLEGLAMDGVYYFQLGSGPDAMPQDFGASQAVAKMILSVGRKDAHIFVALSVRAEHMICARISLYY